MQLREWNARLHGLVVFRALLGDPVVAKLAALTDRLEAADDTIAPLCDAVAAFEAALFAHTTNLGDYLSNAVLETETVCVRQAAAGRCEILDGTQEESGYRTLKLHVESDADVRGVISAVNDAVELRSFREIIPSMNDIFIRAVHGSL